MKSRAGNTKTWDAIQGPERSHRLRLYEAVRDMLSHHMVIRDGRIANYHPYPPTPWNASPRDSYGTPGPYEDAIQGHCRSSKRMRPDKFKGIDIMRTVRSFDPCLPCGVHMYLGPGNVIEKRHSPTLLHTTDRNLRNGPMSKEDYNLERTAERIDTLIKKIEASGDRVMREKAEELVRILTDLQGAALGKILEYVRDSGETAEKLLDRLTHDELIEGLLVVHGLHPQDVKTRVIRALDRLSPSLEAHGGGVKYLDFNDGILSLQLEGSCHGCPSSSATLNSSIQKAVEEAAPEVLRIEVKEANTAASGGANKNGRTPMSNHMAAERCGFCAEALTSDHSHVVDLETRRLLCSCRACYLLLPGEELAAENTSRCLTATFTRGI